MEHTQPSEVAGVVHPRRRGWSTSEARRSSAEKWYTGRRAGVAAPQLEEPRGVAQEGQEEVEGREGAAHGHADAREAMLIDGPARGRESSSYTLGYRPIPPL